MNGGGEEVELKHGDVVTVPFASGTQAAVVLYMVGDAAVRVLRYAASRGRFKQTSDSFLRAAVRPGHRDPALEEEVREAFEERGWGGRR